MNERQLSLITLLIKETTYLTLSVLSDGLNISERTLSKDLTLIEEFLLANHLSLILERKKGTGILLQGLPHEKEKLLTLISHHIQSSVDNQKFQELLIFHILQMPTDRISLDDLADQLFVNRKMIQEEMKKLMPYFEQYGLKLISKPGVGTQVHGDEHRKRRLLIETLKNIKRSGSNSPLLKDFFKQDTVKVIHEILKEVLLAHEITVDSELANIEIHIYFMLERMRSSSEIILNQTETEAVDNTEAQELSSQVLAKLSSIYPIKFSPNEINFLALRIASIFPSSRSDSLFDEESKSLMTYLLDQIDDVFGYDLKQDNLLKENLISHLSSTYFRLNYHLSISNPLTEDVFNAYPQLFLVLQLTADDYFKQKEQFIPQEEIAYLAIHFQAAIERLKYRKSRTYNILLVSEYSKAMASFIEARLNREIPELNVVALMEYQEMTTDQRMDQIDFILSTVPFYHQEKKVLEISPMITASDVLDIEKYMLTHSPNEHIKQFDLSSFTQPFLIYPQLDLKSPDAILNFMGSNLVNNHYVEKQFVAELLNRDKYASTRVAPQITLPHANPKYVIKSTISIATLKEAMDWHGESIRLVVLIAVNKIQLKHPEFKKLFSVIHFLSQSQERFEQLCQTQNVLEILNLLSEYE